jgi:PAS domain S-box-containing protein
MPVEPLAHAQVLTRVFDRCPVSIQIVNPDGLTAYVNAAFLDLFGLPDPNEVVGRLNLRTAPSPPWSGLREALAGALAGGETEVPELATPARPGGTIWTRATLTPLCDADGQVEGAVIQYERLNVALASPAGRGGQNLAAAPSETARLFGAQHDVDAILRELVRGAAMIGGVSRCVVATYDPARTLLIGRAASVAPTTLGLAALAAFRVNPAQAPLTRAALAGEPQVARPGAAEFLPPLGGEEVAAGSRFGQQGLLVVPMQVEGVPLGALYIETRPEQAGFTAEEVGLASALVRQTALALGAAQLQARTGQLLTQVAEAKARLDTVINSASEGILLLDSTSRVAIANPFVHTLYGVTQGRLVGVGLDVLRERLAGAFAAYADIAVAFPAGSERDSEEERVIEYRLARPRPRIVRQIAGPVYDRTGASLGQIIVIHDITDESAALRAQDELLRVASHELKTPVTSIKGFGQLLQRELTAPAGPNLDRARRHLTRMLGQLDRLTALVNELLDVSRIESGRLELHRDRCDLTAIVTDVIERQVSSMVGAPRQIRFAGEMGRFSGEWDPNRIDQAVTNLLDNALKYSSPGSIVRVALTEQNGQAHLAISDEGIGIPASQLAGLFAPFARATNATAQAYTGIGLGLYIVRRIIERHGGQAWAESIEGQGSTFHILLPLAKSD